MTTQALERAICETLVAQALAAQYAISVYDGEAYALKRSTDPAEIIAAMFSTDGDQLILRRPDGLWVGGIVLIYGNGADVISNYTDNPAIRVIVERVSTAHNL